MNPMKFDVVVIGGGHAGTEAAHAAARMGCKTCLITQNVKKIGALSCNPAMGGLAKGQLVREIDALGGVMGMNTDKAAIQYRKLNSSKGPAVRSSRAQCDKYAYAREMQKSLREVENLHLFEGEVKSLEMASGSSSEKVTGVRLVDGSLVRSTCVIVTSGTFLGGLLFTGFSQNAGGRVGERSADFLSESLKSAGFELRRLKTGTPPRLHRESIDWEKVEPQPGDKVPSPFSFYFSGNQFPILPQVNCHITYTNEKTHEIIEANFSRSPMFTGLIQGTGPRYCPSIEDKVKRFRQRERHQIFLEPESLESDDIYVNGISTSLPKDVQEEFVRSIVGLERAQFTQFGYAVEYDCVDARQLRATFESKDVRGLFFAGQVNGTSGYEEAGAQGLIAGINAAMLVREGDPVVFSRTDGYLGVMADDLVLRGADEPYRMFTSRAEYRLVLREDNADLRLSEIGYRIGLLPEEHYRKFCLKRDKISEWSKRLTEFSVLPTEATHSWMSARGMPVLKDRVLGDVFLRRPEVTWQGLLELGFEASGVEAEVSEQVEIQTKYEGYIKRDFELMEGIRRNEQCRISSSVDFELIPGLSNEVKGRLKAVRPETIGQASRMPGVTPAAVANLMIFIQGKRS